MCVSPVLLVVWNMLFIQAHMAGYPGRTAAWSWVCFLVNKHWFLSGLVGKIYFNPLVNPEVRESSLAERSPTRGSEAVCCMKEAWWVERNPVTPLEMQMLLLFCRTEPCWASQKGRGVQVSFVPPGKCKHKLWSDANERTPADFGISLQVRRKDIIWTSLLLTTKRIVTIKRILIATKRLCHHQSWHNCKTFWTKIRRSVNRGRRTSQLHTSHSPLFSGAVWSLLWPGLPLDQINTLWRCQGDSVGLQISTALSLAPCPARTQSLTHAIGLQCSVRERKKPQPFP